MKKKNEKLTVGKLIRMLSKQDWDSEVMIDAYPKSKPVCKKRIFYSQIQSISSFRLDKPNIPMATLNLKE